MGPAAAGTRAASTGAPASAAWEERDTTELTPLEREFLAASTERAERERNARRRRTRITVGALAVVAAVIAAIAIFAFVQRNDANDQRDVATSRQLAGTSTLARARDPELATLLAESAYAASPTIEAEESLRQGVHESTIRATLRTPDSWRRRHPGAAGSARSRQQLGQPAALGSRGGPARRLTASRRHVAEGHQRGPVRTTEGFVTGDETARWCCGRTHRPRGRQRIASVPARVEYLHALAAGDGVIAATTEGAWVMRLADRRPRRVVEGSFYDAVDGPTAAPTSPSEWTSRCGAGRARRRHAQIPVPSGARTIAVSPGRNAAGDRDGDGIDVRRLADDSLVFSAPVTPASTGSPGPRTAPGSRPPRATAQCRSTRRRAGACPGISGTKAS